MQSRLPWLILLPTQLWINASRLRALVSTDRCLIVSGSVIPRSLSSSSTMRSRIFSHSASVALWQPDALETSAIIAKAKKPCTNPVRSPIEALMRRALWFGPFRSARRILVVFWTYVQALLTWGP
jgi:hypothetical protein